MPEAATRFGLAQAEYESEDAARMAQLEANPATWAPDPDEVETPEERRARKPKKRRRTPPRKRRSR